MAEKKHGLGTVLLIGAAAAAVAGGVISYIKRAEIKRLADEIITKVKPTDTDGLYTADLDGDGEPDLDGDGRIDIAVMDAGEPNIVDSGISLEDVEKSGQDSAEQAEAGPEAQEVAEAADTPEAAADDAGEGAPEPEAEADGESETPDTDEQGKKKIWFWSK